MNDEKNLNDELDEELENESEPGDLDNADNEDFEFDEEGDIIVRDGEKSSGDGDEDPETVDPDDSDGASALDDKAQESVAQPSGTESGELNRLRQELESYKSQTRDTLKKMGVDADDPLQGLVNLAAEADGISVDDYLKKKADAELQAEANRQLEAQEYERVFESDLAELHKAFPETAKYKHIAELPDSIRSEFAKYRDLGLSAEKAYAAANPRGVRNDAVSSANRVIPPTKNHLKTVVPKGSRDNSVQLSSQELEQYREMFPDASDEEIKALYKSATRK